MSINENASKLSSEDIENLYVLSNKIIEETFSIMYKIGEFGQPTYHQNIKGEEGLRQILQDPIKRKWLRKVWRTTEEEVVVRSKA